MRGVTIYCWRRVVRRGYLFDVEHFGSLCLALPPTAYSRGSPVALVPVPSVPVFVPPDRSVFSYIVDSKCVDSYTPLWEAGAKASGYRGS